jgi:Transposase DDE domain group 1
MTECNQIRFSFAAHYSRKVVAQFADTRLTTDGGGVLLRQVDRKVGLLRRLVGCFQDGRDPDRIEHRLEEMLAQRIYGLALGYEDLNDHEQLRQDPLLSMLAGKRELNEPLAGKSTLNRMELVPRGEVSEQRYHKITYSQEAIDQLLVDLFLESQETVPRQIILDLDATDLRLHGKQEGRFFHGFYGHYCYLPLYIFCGDHLLCARLRSSNIDASAGSLAEVQRIVAQIRARWPKTRIILRADSGFCRDELMSWCEQQGVEYVFGFARNKRLRRRIAPAMRAAKQAYRSTGKPARVFTEFRYRTRKSWSRARRVIAKAEQIAGKENPRYIVTSLTQPEWTAQNLYEQLYCARGEMENRIKEQLSLFADRMSTEALRSNQLRLYLSSMAYLLVHALRRLGLQGTEWAQAQVHTIRLRILKIAAQVRVTARRIWILYTSSYPWKDLYHTVWSALRC